MAAPLVAAAGGATVVETAARALLGGWACLKVRRRLAGARSATTCEGSDLIDDRPIEKPPSSREE